MQLKFRSISCLPYTFSALAVAVAVVVVAVVIGIALIIANKELFLLC